MMQISAREKRLLLVTVAIAAFCLLYRTVAAPLGGRWRALATEASTLQGELIQHRVSLRQRAQIEERYEKLETEIRQKESNEKEISRLMQLLSSRYEALGLADKGTRVLATEERGFCRRFRFKVELEGGVLPLASFLDEIIGSKEPLRVEELTVRATGRYEVIRATIVLSALFAVSGEEPEG